MWSTGVRTFRPDCSGSLPQTTQPVTPAVVLIRCRGIEQVPDVVTAPTANRSGPAGRSYLFGGPGALIDRLLYGSAGHAHAEADVHRGPVLLTMVSLRVRRRCGHLDGLYQPTDEWRRVSAFPGMRHEPRRCVRMTDPAPRLPFACDLLQDHRFGRVIKGPVDQIPRSESRGIVFQDTASVRFGVEGLQVTDADEAADGTVEVWAVTDYPAAAACLGCGTISGRVHERVVTRPRDVRRAGDAVDLRWVKVGASARTRSARARRSLSRCRPCRRGAGSRRGCGSRPLMRSPSGGSPRRRMAYGARRPDRGCGAAHPPGPGPQSA